MKNGDATYFGANVPCLSVADINVNCDKTSLNDFVSAPLVAVVSHDCEDCMQLIVVGGGLR